MLIDSVRVERQANMARISLRSVCPCNPGVREVALGSPPRGCRPVTLVAAIAYLALVVVGIGNAVVDVSASRW